MRLPLRAIAARSALLVLAALFLPACGGGDSVKGKPAQTPPPSTAAAPKTPFSPVDACSLLTKPEVEALVGKAVMEPRQEQAANLVTCAYGDPAAPKIGDRPLTQVLTLAVFTGEEGAYYAGSVAQAKDAYEMARKNAASSEAVSGLGESAYWDKTFHSLTAHQGRYWISVDVEGDAGIEIAKKLLGQALARLPS
jgi:hypothetical protein